MIYYNRLDELKTINRKILMIKNKRNIIPSNDDSNLKYKLGLIDIN